MAENEIDQALFPDPSKLQDAEKMWGEAEDLAAAAKPVGNFTGVIGLAELGRAASSDRLQIHYHVTIEGGPSDGVELDKYDGLGSPEQTNITQQQLKNVGIDTKSVTIKTLPAHLLGLKDKKVIFTGKKNGQYYNINFLKLAGNDQTGSARTTPTAGKPGAPRGGKKKF